MLALEVVLAAVDRTFDPLGQRLIAERFFRTYGRDGRETSIATAKTHWIAHMETSSPDVKFHCHCGAGIKAAQGKMGENPPPVHVRRRVDQVATAGFGADFDRQT